MSPRQRQLRPRAGPLTNAVTVREAENAFCLVEGDVLLNLHHVLVEAGARPAKKESTAPSGCLLGGLPLRAKRQVVETSGRHHWGRWLGTEVPNSPGGQGHSPQAKRTRLSLWSGPKGVNRGETSAR